VAPLCHSDGRLLGVLSLDVPKDGLRPRDTDLAVLAGVAAHVSQMLESAEANQARERLKCELHEAERTVRRQALTLEQTVRVRTRELELARIETLQRLALAAEFRDDETRQHTERVGSIAASLASEIGLPAEQVAVIRHAAPLHDIGKLGVADTILLKAGKLAPLERERMQTHTTIGARILSGSQSEVLRIGQQIALTHHEWWDGRGYPNGTAGDSIPITGRVTAIADVFDALTHARPYKEVWPVRRAVSEIQRQRLTHFDPQLVDAFMELDHELLAGLRSRPAGYQLPH
jgi:putative two-component system response regulator